MDQASAGPKIMVSLNREDWKARSLTFPNQVCKTQASLLCFESQLAHSYKLRAGSAEFCSGMMSAV